MTQLDILSPTPATPPKEKPAPDTLNASVAADVPVDVDPVAPASVASDVLVDPVVVVVASRVCVDPVAPTSIDELHRAVVEGNQAHQKLTDRLRETLAPISWTNAWVTVEGWVLNIPDFCAGDAGFLLCQQLFGGGSAGDAKQTRDQFVGRANAQRGGSIVAMYWAAMLSRNKEEYDRAKVHLHSNVTCRQHIFRGVAGVFRIGPEHGPVPRIPVQYFGTCKVAIMQDDDVVDRMINTMRTDLLKDPNLTLQRP
jgi:hypothetical protein